MRIGVLIPEFPGQTHAFFWRELGELRKLGIAPDLVSTRRPSREIVCHGWSEAASAETLYLAPPSTRLILGGLLRLVAAGPARWLASARAMRRAQGLRTKDLPKVVALGVLGAALAAEARKRGWAHIHVHSAADSALLALFARVFGGPPYSLTLHGDIQGYGVAQNVKWEHATFGITVNSMLRQAVLDHAPSVSMDRLSVAPMGVDTEKFRRDTAYRPPERHGEVRVVTCGRLHPGKAHGDIIRAVALLRSRGVRASLAILGEGPDREALESLRAELDCVGHVELAGAVTEEEVRRRLHDAHMFVLASRNEALGVATMEAMAMELPVIVTDVGGVSELVRAGVDGILIPPSQPDAIAGAIEMLITDPGQAHRLSAAGRQRIVAGFTSAESARVMAERLGAVPPREATSSGASMGAA